MVHQKEVSNLFVIQPVSYSRAVARHPAHEYVPLAIDFGEVADASVPVPQVVVVRLDVIGFIIVVSSAARLPQVGAGCSRAVPRRLLWPGQLDATFTGRPPGVLPLQVDLGKVATANVVDTLGLQK